MKCRKRKVIPAPKGHKRQSAALHLVSEEGRICLFLSVGNGHLNQCGTPQVDWRYCSPKSVLLDAETKRGQTVAHMIEKAECISDMLGIPIVDEVFGIPIDWKPRKRQDAAQAASK
jgi:hypothetical protein